MSARSLLNAASINGCLITAAVLGLLTGSAFVGLCVFAACIAVAFIGGEIRLAPDRRK
jgi:hypothetical protein